MAEESCLSTGDAVCRSEELAECGLGVRFRVRHFGREEAAFAVRYQGAVRAYFNRCAHVPTELDWNHGDFFDSDRRFLICGTHGAIYAPDSGQCLGGRCAGKGLKPLLVVEREGFVYLAGEEVNER